MQNVQGWCATEQYNFSAERQQIQLVAQPKYLDLPTPFYVLVEQRAVKCTKKKSIEFSTEVFLVPTKKSSEELKKDFSGKCVATKTSKYRQKSVKDEQSMDKEAMLKIQHSTKGVHVQLVWWFNEFKLDSEGSATPPCAPWDDTWPKLIPVKMTDSEGKKIEGELRLTTSYFGNIEKEKIDCGITVNVGLKDVTNIGTPSTNLKKEATDPSKSIKLNMNVQFDDKKMSLMFTNTATADVSEKTNTTTGSVEVKEKIESSLKY